MSSEPRRKFDQDFKRTAVLLCTELGQSVVEVVQNLAIGKDLDDAENITEQMGNKY